MSRKPKKVYMDNDSENENSVKETVEKNIEDNIEKKILEQIDDQVAIEASGEELEDELTEEESSEEEVALEAASETSGGEISQEESTEVVSDEVIEQIVNQKASLRSKVEAVIFASPKPMKTVEIFELLSDGTPAPKKSAAAPAAETTESTEESTEEIEVESPQQSVEVEPAESVEKITLEQVQEELDQLIEFYQNRAGGFTLKYVKRMGYQFQTTNSVRSVMEKQFASRPRPLTRASLETLAVVAYRQKKSKGVTRAEVEFIRGVDAGGIFKTLVERGMLQCTGRKEIPGRPLMFVVTDEFLKTFQLSSTDDLPPLESFQIPPETLSAAQEKIQAFEAEQEAAVNPEKFIADETYRDEETAVGDITGPDVTAEAAVSEVASEEVSPAEISPEAIDVADGERQGASITE